LTGTFRAWLSDSKSSPAVRFPKDAGPYRLVTGATVANNWSGLDPLLRTVTRGGGHGTRPLRTPTVWMPPRKSEQIIQVLRQEILSGRRAPGARLPTYDDFVEQFGVTRPTVARGLKALRSEGLVTAAGTRGVFVAKTFPHTSRTLWVTSERPGEPGWTSLSAAILDLVERGDTGIPGELVPLLGVDGRHGDPAYRTLCDAVRQGSAAGLLVTSSPATRLLPALQAPGLARVALGGPAAHAVELRLDFDALIARAVSRLARGARARRIAVLSPHAPHLERARDTLRAHGVDGRRLALLHVAPVGCEALTHLLFERDDRPDAVLVTDDALVGPLLAGLARARVRPGREVRIVAHGDWPRGTDDDGVEQLGFDARELLAAAKELLDARRDGCEGAPRALAPRFADELAPARGQMASAA
jgi:hypothetical protein